MTMGSMIADWEQRIDVGAMRTYRLDQAQQGMEKAGLAALVCFDAANVRYVTSTHIGTWALDKMGRYCIMAASRSCTTSAAP
jgi:Xaa-Pro aminopeptidase